MKVDYFYCVATSTAFKLQAMYNWDCSGPTIKDVHIKKGQGVCMPTNCNVGSLNIASAGDCPNRQVSISYWEGADCSGKWYGYGYASRDTCRTLWSSGLAFQSLFLRCASEADDCVSQKTCVADPEPASPVCKPVATKPPSAASFHVKSHYHNDCTGDVKNDVSVSSGSNGVCLDTGCAVASLDLGGAGDCPDGEVQVSYWGGANCAGDWYGYGYASRDTCRPLWSEGWKFKSLYVKCAKESENCVKKGTCVADAEPSKNLC